MRNKFILIFGPILIIVIGIFLHTTSLTVSHHSLVLGQSGKKLKIAHVSDLHTNGMGRLETELVQALDNEKPDIIIITGDMATPSGTHKGYKDVLTKFKASRGVFFVPGNWEYWEPIKNLSGLLKDSGITNLTNQVRKIDDGIWLVGFDDSEEGVPELKVIKDLPTQDIKISFFHSPSFFDQVASMSRINFAGHSHGGQVRIPLMGSVWVPEGTGKYDQGWFEKGTSKMYVSRGIGTSLLPIRFNCSPELAVIELRY